MFQFNYNYSNYWELQKDLAEATGAVKEGDTIHYTGNVFSGWSWVVEMPNGLEAIITDIEIMEDVLFHRVRSAEEYYILRVEEMSFERPFTLKVGDEDVPVETSKRSAVVLTSSLFNFGYLSQKGTYFRSISILLHKNWLAKYLGIKNDDEVLQKYISLKAENLNLEPFDANYRHLMGEIFDDHDKEKPFQKITVQNRMMLLVEYFFERLFKKMDAAKDLLKVNSTEIEKLMNAEALLVSDFSKPAPTIPALARRATMSETKFKMLFKKIYNQSPYNYYQLNRMNKARQLLLTKKYSVKEVGKQLGFSNLSNFTIAFKKVFNELPSEI